MLDAGVEMDSLRLSGSQMAVGSGSSLHILIMLTLRI